MVYFQSLTIEKSGHAVNARHNDMVWFAAGGNVLREVLEADFRETIVSSPAVGSNRLAWAYRRLDEQNEALGRYVSDTCHANMTGAPSADFSGNSDNRFLFCFPTDNACFVVANICFVNLGTALQKVSVRSNYASATLMKPRPSRLVAAKTKYPLHPQCNAPGSLGTSLLCRTTNLERRRHNIGSTGLRRSNGWFGSWGCGNARRFSVKRHESRWLRQFGGC